MNLVVNNFTLKYRLKVFNRGGTAAAAAAAAAILDAALDRAGSIRSESD
jgi:hypothetical protein